MAAGMGSRYGGLKQIDPIGPNGEVIIDYSLYDAKQAGFEKVVCIIKHQIEDDFKAVMNRGAAKHMDVQYAFQQIEDIPAGFAIPEGREKPWGTGHAILAAKDLCDAPFAVINAPCQRMNSSAHIHGRIRFLFIHHSGASSKFSTSHSQVIAKYKYI